MTEYSLQASFSFACTDAEMDILQEIFEAASDLLDDRDPSPPSPKFLELFPPETGEDVWSGLRGIFCDGEFPDFGAILEGGGCQEGTSSFIAHIHGMESFQPDPVAKVIHICCQASLAKEPTGFEWSVSCSRPRENEFGGGWCAIFADRIEMNSTGEALAAAMERPGLPDNPTGGGIPWSDHPEHPIDDWKYEVANDDTRLGYLDWIAAREGAAGGDAAPTAFAPVQEATGLYLHLYHGRKDPDEDLEDWGSDGPVIGPLAYVHTTYMCDIKFAAAPDVMATSSRP